MRTRASLFLIAVAVTAVASGCTGRPAGPSPGAATSLPATESLPGGGVRANLVTHGLRFSTDVSKTVVPMHLGTEVVVRLRLTNAGSKAVTWTNLKLGWEASIVDPRGQTSFLAGLLSRPPAPALGYRAPHIVTTLAPGESTSAVVAGGPTIGTYGLRGGFVADAGPSGRTPAITVVVLPRQ